MKSKFKIEMARVTQSFYSKVNPFVNFRDTISQVILLYHFSYFSINLMTVMGSLTTIAKQRPVYFDQVVQAFESLHGKWPFFIYIFIYNERIHEVKRSLKSLIFLYFFSGIFRSNVH